MHRALVLVPALFLVGGCMLQNLSKEERLRDSVVGYNDECRWGRIDLAAQRVMPAYRQRFRLTHHGWGRNLQIADSEIVHVETAGEDSEVAISTVIVRWYDQSTMILADSTLRQSWKKVHGGYILLEEAVVAGHPGLLEIPPELLPDPDDAAGGAEDATEPTGEAAPEAHASL
jgi:hypothetical protein